MDMIEQVRELVAEKGWTCIARSGAEHPAYVYLTWPMPDNAPARFTGNALHIGAVVRDGDSADDVLRTIAADLAKEDFDPIAGEFSAPIAGRV